MIKLTITEKGGEPRALTFDKDEISIGRVSGNDIVLPKGNVSKRHSKLVTRDGDLEVVDLKSTNGTYVNGRKIAEPTAVTAADKIYVGDFLIILDGEGAAAADSDGHGAEGVSASRRLPVPPPPPPPASRHSASMSTDVIEDDGPSEVSADDDESLGLAVKPPRGGRMPLPPPPPPPRRSGAHPALGLEDDGVDIGGDLAPPSPSDVSGAEDDLGPTSGPALFEGARASDFDEPGRRATTGNRADAVLPSEGNFSGPTSTGSGRAAVAEAVDFAERAAERATVAHDVVASHEGLEALLADPAVTQILITGPDTVLVERAGRLSPLETSLGDPNTVADVLWRIASTAVPPPPPDNPVVDVRLVDGTRIAALFPPATATGVCASIRKASLPDRSLAELGPAGTLAKEAQSVLEAALAAQRNIMVTGDAGAIAALLGALGAAVPADRRVVAIAANSATVRPGRTDLTPTGDMPSLIRVAAALRGDYLLLGEPVGTEALDVLMAAARGQDGVLFGLTARSASEALARVEALATQNLGTSAVPQLANSAIDLVVHIVALAEGGARIVEIAEVKLDNANRLATDPVLVWRSEGSRRAGAGGKMQIIGVSSRMAATVAASGGSLPSNLIRK